MVVMATAIAMMVVVAVDIVICDRDHENDRTRSLAGIDRSHWR